MYICVTVNVYVLCICVFSQRWPRLSGWFLSFISPCAFYCDMEFLFICLLQHFAGQRNSPIPMAASTNDSIRVPSRLPGYVCHVFLTSCFFPTLWDSEQSPLGRRKRRVRECLPCPSHSWECGQEILWETNPEWSWGKWPDSSWKNWAGDLWGQGTWGLGAAQEDSQTTQCYHRNLVPSNSVGGVVDSVDTAVKITEEAEASWSLWVWGHPILRSESSRPPSATWWDTESNKARATRWGSESNKPEQSLRSRTREHALSCLPCLNPLAPHPGPCNTEVFLMVGVCIKYSEVPNLLAKELTIKVYADLQRNNMISFGAKE